MGVSRKIMALSTLGIGFLPVHCTWAIDYFFANPSVGAWNNPQNWVGPPVQMVPQGGQGNNAFIDNGGTALIGAGPVPTPIPDIENIFVGVGDGGVGVLNHFATNIFQGTQGTMTVGRSGGTGEYNMSGTAVQGKQQLIIGGDGGIVGPGIGALTMTDNASLELSTFMGGVGNFTQSSAMIDMSGNASFVTLGNFWLSSGQMDVIDQTPLISDAVIGVVGGDLIIGDRRSRNAGLSMDYGEIRVSGDLFIGRDGSTGIVDLTGSAVLSKIGGPTSSIRIGAVGSEGGGQLNVSGNALIMSDTNMVIAESEGRNGEVNQEGGWVELKNQGASPGQESLIIDGAGFGVGRYNLSGGVLKLQSVDATSGVLNFTGGELHVNDIFRGDLIQKGGTFSPGNTPGDAFITGSYNVTEDEVDATLLIEIWGDVPVLDYDYMNVTENVHLNGTLKISVVDDSQVSFMPNAGDVFDVLDWGGVLVGDFDDYEFDDIGPDLYWNASTFTTDGKIHAALVGDLDMDGDVDGVDLGGFFAAFTGPGGNTPKGSYTDLDGDGDTDGVDIAMVFAKFTGPAAPVVVPEPGSLCLLLAGGLFTLRRRRRPVG